MTIHAHFWSLFWFYDFSCYCTGCCCPWGCQIDFNFGCTHTAQEVTVVGSNYTLTISQDTAGPAAAESTARMSDHGTGFCQSIHDAQVHGLLVDLTAGRCDDQFHIISYFLCLSELLQQLQGLPDGRWYRNR